MSSTYRNCGGNNKLRVAYMLSRFPYLYETFVLNEMYWMRKQGVDIHIFSMMKPRPGPVHQRTQELMDVVHYSPLLSWPTVKANLFFLFAQPITYLSVLLWVIKTTYRSPRFMAYVLALFPKSVLFARIIGSLGVSHVHAQFAWTQQIAAIIASRLLDLSNSVTVHAFELYTQNLRIVRSQLEASDRIVTISEYNRRVIADLCRNKTLDDVALIRLGVDLDQFAPNPERSHPKRLRLLSVGNLIEKKGHQHLVRACNILAQRQVDFDCSIVGEGHKRAELEALIGKYKLAGHVNLTGALEQHRVRDLYQQSDIFALACVVASNGDRDGMPTVLIEAMACRMPVVTTPVTGIPELVADGENGFLVPERDADALANAIQTLIEDEALRLKMGRNGRQRIVRDFDIQHNTAKLIDLFREVARRD